MRIFLSMLQARRRHAVPAYAFWEFYFRNALTEAGHELVEAPGVDWAEGLTAMDRPERSRWLGETWSRTVDFLKKEHARAPVDFFLGYLFPNQVEPTAVAAIRAMGIPCVNFFCDNVREFRRVPASYHGFDLHWVPEADARALYAAAGLPYLYAPMPMWVAPQFRDVTTIETRDVAFIGSHDPLREALLSEAVELGLPLKLYGDGWTAPISAPSAPPAAARSLRRTLANQVDFWREHGVRGFAMRATYQLQPTPDRTWIDRCWQPAVKNDDYFMKLRESGVIIGINRYPSFRHSFRQPGRYSRLRDIEAPMLGACYLTEWAPGLADLYDLEKEIATFRTAGELVEQTKRLQADPELRRNLRTQGQRRALADHTLARSIRRIAEKLSLR